MEGMDTKFLAHIGGEIVALGGMFIYFQRKTNYLTERLENLEKQNEAMQRMIEEYMSYNQHQRVVELPQRKRQTAPRHQIVSAVSDVESEADFDDVALDAELKEEMTELKNCENGVCELPPDTEGA